MLMLVLDYRFWTIHRQFEFNSEDLNIACVLSFLLLCFYILKKNPTYIDFIYNRYIL